MIQAGFSDWPVLQNFLRHRIKEKKVLVIGDSMLDRYYFGDVRRISPEAPVPIALIREVRETLGGAANVSHNLARLGCEVHLAGITGQDHMRTTMIKLLMAQGIQAEGLIAAEDRPTITKTRVIGGHQQILRLDFEESAPVNRKLESALLNYIRSMMTVVDSVILSDYAKGVCTPRLCQIVIQEGARQGKPVIIDPKGNDWRKYKGAYLVTPNLKELSEAAQADLANEDAPVERVAKRLRSRFQLASLLVTRSEKGMSLISEEDSVHIPTMAQEVFDVSGAGDTVVAVLGAALADGMKQADAAQLANMAAGVVVGKVGTYAISREELIEAVCSSQYHIGDDIQ